MPYLSKINPSTGYDEYEGIEILKVFVDLRMELSRREIMDYNENDPLYRAICDAEEQLRVRLAP